MNPAFVVDPVAITAEAEANRHIHAAIRRLASEPSAVVTPIQPKPPCVFTFRPPCPS